MSKLINITDEESLQKAINKLTRAINLISNNGGKKAEVVLFDSIIGLLHQYPNFPVNKDKTLQHKFNDVMNVLSSATFTMIERYCDGNRAGAYYAADLMSKMIMRKLSEKHESEERKIEVK